MKFLILGHPRGGTAYAAKLMQSAGLDVRHEEMGANGIASWMFAVHDIIPPFTFDRSRRSDTYFDAVIHVAREPLDTIASTLHTEQGSEDFRSRYVNLFGNAMERAVLSYCGWHRLILAGHADIRCRLEDLSFHLEERYGINTLDPGPVNTREHPKLDWNEIHQNCSPEVLFELEKMTKWYQQLR